MGSDVVDGVGGPLTHPGIHGGQLHFVLPGTGGTGTTYVCQQQCQLRTLAPDTSTRHADSQKHPQMAREVHSGNLLCTNRTEISQQWPLTSRPNKSMLSSRETQQQLVLLRTLGPEKMDGGSSRSQSLCCFI